MSTRLITGSMLRDLVQCERRVHHDLHTDPGLRDGVSDFVRMLWENGVAHERETLSGLGRNALDLREATLEERARETERGLGGDATVILGGLLQRGDRLGMPDILDRLDGEWTAGDVKCGMATEPDGARPRMEYAVQVAHYASLLGEIGYGAADRAYVLDGDGNRTTYDLKAAWGRNHNSITDVVAGLTAQARLIRDGGCATRGAISAICKLCHWRTLCEGELRAADDLTLIAGVGRSLRDAISPVASDVATLATLDTARLSEGRGGTSIPGVGMERLSRLRDRARLLRTPGAAAYARVPLDLPTGHREIPFDIEADPTRDTLVYLHGFLVRDPIATGFHERYHHIFAETPDHERDAFAQAVRFLDADPDAHVYYYSKYERSAFRLLATRYPDVCARSDVDRLFDPARATDLLFDVIMPHTEWPTGNLSIKTLARHLGFEWRDTDASGAASIAWFDRYVRTGDHAVKQRILDYNEDDVRASSAVLDGLRLLRVSDPPPWPPRAPPS